MEYKYKVEGGHHQNEIWTGYHIIDGKIEVSNFRHYASDVRLIIDVETNEITGWSFGWNGRQLTACPVSGQA